MNESLLCFSLLGSIADVLIYVLLTNNNREYVAKLCCPCHYDDIAGTESQNREEITNAWIIKKSQIIKSSLRAISECWIIKNERKKASEISSEISENEWFVSIFLLM